MPEHNINESRDYLLGKLPVAAAEDFEDRFFASEDLLREVEQEQHALVEHYLSGTLSAPDERLFRDRIERSTTLQNKVEVHRTLLRALERRAHPNLEVPLLPRKSRSWAWLAAACVALFAVLVALFLHHATPKKLPSAQAATELPAQPSASLAAKIPTPPTPAAAPSPLPATFFLSAAVARGVNATPVLKIPAGTSLIELQVELPVSAASIPQWKLLDLDGTPPSTPTTGLTRHAGGDAYVPIHLPPQALPTGNHTIRLQSATTPTTLTRHFTTLLIPAENPHLPLSQHL